MTHTIGLYLAMVVMTELNGCFLPGSLPSGASRGGPSGGAERGEYRLGEELFQYGLLRGQKHAMAGLDYGPAMTKDPGTVPWYGFGGVDLDSGPGGAELFKRILAQPPHLRPMYFEAFLAGYKLGHVLNLPERRQVLLMSLDNLVRLGGALITYTSEGDGRFPPMNDVPTLRKALGGFAKGSNFIDPRTNEPYRLNSSLAGRSRLDLKAHAKWTVVAYEAASAPDGTRGVLFVTGEVRRVPEREWPRLKRASVIQ